MKSSKHTVSPMSLVSAAEHAAPSPCATDASCPAEHTSALFHAPFVATAADRDALTDAQLVAINIDITTAVITVVGVVPQLLALRDEFLEQLPKFPIERLDKLETYARALGYANGIYLATGDLTDNLPQLGADAIKLRDSLVLNARPLADKKFLPADRLAEITNSTGYKDNATYLTALVAMYRAAWKSIHNHTSVEPADLDRAEDLVNQIYRAVGQREHTAAAATDATRDRQRAFTLLMNAYDQVRRAVTYLRWDDGDVNDLAPSLYVGRGNTVRHKDTSATDPTAPATAASPASPASASPASASHTAPAAPVHSVPASITDPTVTVPAGNPFVK